MTGRIGSRKELVGKKNWIRIEVGRNWWNLRVTEHKNIRASVEYEEE